MEGQSRYAALRPAWLQHVGREQRRGIVLHNAAMFFAVREPAFAATLLKRAIEAEPDVPLYVERLGAVYGYAHLPDVWLGNERIAGTAEREDFALQARSELLSSDNWMLLAGAWSTSSKGFQLPRDLSVVLSARLQALTGTDNWSNVLKLPSYSARYRTTECEVSSQDAKR